VSEALDRINENLIHFNFSVASLFPPIIDSVLNASLEVWPVREAAMARRGHNKALVAEVGDAVVYSSQDNFTNI
jgi:hypothetical protein